MKPAQMLNSKNAQPSSESTGLTYSDAMNIALYALAPRARSRAELHAHLIKRNFDESIAEAVLDQLELEGLLNDLEFAQLWSESRQRQKKMSKRIISQELRTKGVSQDIIDEVIAEIDDESEYKLAYELAERKYRSCSHLEPEKIYGRISGALARKGFSGSLASRIIRELMGTHSE
jgi:regulatory protein